MSDFASKRKELLTILQSEYVALKSEQATRILIRENALYINFAVVAAIAAVAYSQSPPKPLFLLCIPFATCTVYWVYLNNDLMVTALRHFFSDVFPDRVLDVIENLSTEERSLLRKSLASWEVYHRALPTRKFRKIANTTLILLGYLGTSLTAIAVITDQCFLLGGWPLFLWSIDAILILALAVVLVVTGDW